MQNPANRTQIPSTGTIAVDGTNTARTLPVYLPFAIGEVRVLMHTDYVGATATEITVKREKKAGEDTDSAAIGKGTIPITAVEGDVILIKLADFADSTLAPGESISFVSNGGADATTTCSFAAIGYFFDEGNSAENTLVPKQAKARSGIGSTLSVASTEV